MLSLVTAAEQQYRFDTDSRARDYAVLSSRRDRALARAEEASQARSARTRASVAWARPIGAQQWAARCAVA
jgi:hypothetical protein